MTYTFLALMGALLPWASAPAAESFGPPPAALETAPELLDHRTLQAALEKLAREHSELVSLEPVGASRTGRKFGALRIAAGEVGPGRPALLLVANVDAPHAYTSALALHHARALVEGYGTDEHIKALLDTTTVYVIPRADPDGAEARFQMPLRESGGTGAGVDDDRDGRSGEDGLQDVNGDGYVTMMRVLDPEGTWIEDPTDPRVLIEAERDEGQRGRWKLVPEGGDLDGDGEASEDPQYDAVVNRNFAHAWEEHVAAAGLYPTNEPEVRALCEFVLAHPDIALVVTYGAQGNLVEKPKVVKTGKRGDEVLGFFEEDVELLGQLGERYRDGTGNETTGEEQQAGSFQAWCYHHRGLWTLDIALWSVPEEVEASDEVEEIEEVAPDEAVAEPEEPESPDEPELAPEPSRHAKQLEWLEAHGVAPAFLPWTPFEHPELGPVEVGGFAPYVLIEPPAEQLGALSAPHFEFFVGLGELLPRVKLVELEARVLSDGLVEVTGALENDALLPYASKAALDARSVRPMRVRLELPDGATLLGGTPQQLVRQLDGIGGRSELRWLVQTADPSALRVNVDSDHAGAISATPEVK